MVPRPHAGGSWATTCWKNFRDPVAVEEIRAHAGIDIGGTDIKAAVAADGRLLEVHGFTVNESSLTGESLSVEKHTKAIKGRESAVALADRTNMVFSGSLVTSGRAMAVVTATGMDTEIGRIASLMNETKEKKTPLQVSLDRFSGRLAMAIIAICGLVFLLSLYWTP